MTDLINTPIFGIIISIITFEIGLFAYKKTRLPVLNPLFISILLTISFLLIFHIDTGSYMQGGNFISFFLGPATVILAVPLYKQIELFKKNALIILISILTGSTCGMLSIFLLVKAFNLKGALGISLMPKSVTTPIGMEISKQIGGIPSITVAAIIVTGIIGSILGPYICKVFKIKDEVAMGIALGTSAHAIGTTKAIEIGETQGAMSGLAMGVAGILTVFLAPLLLKILTRLF